MFRIGLVLILAATATIAGWRLLDRTVSAADVEGPLQGVTYAPWAGGCFNRMVGSGPALQSAPMLANTPIRMSRPAWPLTVRATVSV